MPRERKQRGRGLKYQQEKLKRQANREARGELPRPKKRRRSDDGLARSQDDEDFAIVKGDAGDDFISFGTQPPLLDETQFHGLLDEEEQEYYANVNKKIMANDFESDEDCRLFVEAVYRESEGKELKLASSQSCSRYLEKLIRLSTVTQLQALFGKFIGSLTYLVQHRFGSHCCETLFLEAAKHVKKRDDTSNDKAESKSLEKSLLQTAEELEPNAGFLLTERFASHSMRVLFLVLSGEPLDNASTYFMLASKKKEKLDMASTAEGKQTKSDRNVPKSFKKALAKLITAAISSLDTTYLRALATHPTGNPVLQLLLRLELVASKKGKDVDDKSLLRKLIPDESLDADADSAKFISGLLYDPTGSHLIEVLVQHTSGKIFKSLYKNVLKERLGSMAKNDVASYVAIRILERLGKDDLAEVQSQLLPEIPTLVERRRTSLIKVLVERCVVREVGLQPLGAVLSSGYGGDKDSLLMRMLSMPDETHSKAPQKKLANETGDSRPTKSDVHGSLLAQSILQAPDVCSIIQDSLLQLDTNTLKRVSTDSAASRVVQVSIKPSRETLAFRKQLIPRFYDQAAELAQDPVGSHVVDALWNATEGLNFMKERLAGELAANESQLRLSFHGRTVWRNWSMDLYQRRPGEWKALARGYTDQPQQQDSAQKSALELARERHAQKKSRSVH